MTKKDFSFKYDIKSKTGKIRLDDKYINLNANEVKTQEISFFSGSFFSSSSNSGGYGLDLLRRKK